MFLLLVVLILSDTGAKLNVEADKITISTVSSSRLRRAAQEAPPATPPTIRTRRDKRGFAVLSAMAVSRSD